MHNRHPVYACILGLQTTDPLFYALQFSTLLSVEVCREDEETGPSFKERERERMKGRKKWYPR